MRGAKSCLKIIYFFVLLFFCFSFVSASCSIGATPLRIDAGAKSGEEVLVMWNFYNLYGDRTTHMVVSKISGPDWEIRYDPVLHEESYDISGVITDKMENLAIENSPVVLEIPKNPPEGVSYVKHPNEKGYIPVKPIKIYIKIPENAEIWKHYEFAFEARGDCFTEPGAVIPALATQLKVDITPKNDFYEKPVSREKKAGFLGFTGAVIGSINTTTKILAITVIFLIIIILILLIKRRKNLADRIGR
ncbi:MAG: hypothetical protein PHH00_02175 [Candidatus Nanoarchaeia archaeon]|nr:hypothetical protein [Candidatus Nanoarchaeia archaeon]